MNNYYNNGSRFSPENDMNSMYPDVYKELYPSVIRAVNDFKRRGVMPNDEVLNKMVDNIIRDNGLWDEDADYDVMPVSAQPFRRFNRRHHNRNSLRDVLRILILRELLGH